MSHFQVKIITWKNALQVKSEQEQQQETGRRRNIPQWSFDDEGGLELYAEYGLEE
jgi:hypothetical protein